MTGEATRDNVVRIATLNVRNTSDRWKERRGLLIDQLVELRPDVIGLQELRRFPRQGKWITDEVNNRLGNDSPGYSLYLTYKTGFYRLREGIGIMSRLPVISRDRLNLLGGHRVAQRVEVELPDGEQLEIYNTHLHHDEQADDIRSIQARMILAWMAQRHGLPKVLVGDLNGVPGGPTIRILYDHLHPTYLEFNGEEPPGTVPTPLVAAERNEEPKVLDYIFINDHLEIRDARLVFDRPAYGDPTLVPSDHFGLFADLRPR